MKLITSVLALLLPLPLLSAPLSTTDKTDANTAPFSISDDVSYLAVEHSVPSMRVKSMPVHDETQIIDNIESRTFIKQKGNNKGQLLDNRLIPWYPIGTIPSVIRTSFALFKNPSVSKIIQTLGATEGRDRFLSFDPVAKLTLFCNRSWCHPSPIAIRDRLNAGYPPETLTNDSNSTQT